MLYTLEYFLLLYFPKCSQSRALYFYVSLTAGASHCPGEAPLILKGIFFQSGRWLLSKPMFTRVKKRLLEHGSCVRTLHRARIQNQTSAKMGYGT